MRAFNEKGPGDCTKCGGKVWVGPIYQRGTPTSGAMAQWIAVGIEDDHLTWVCAKCSYREAMQCKDQSEAEIISLKKKFEILSNS